MKKFLSNARVVIGRRRLMKLRKLKVYLDRAMFENGEIAGWLMKGRIIVAI
jgi:hypothetical protein